VRSNHTPSVGVENRDWFREGSVERQRLDRRPSSPPTAVRTAWWDQPLSRVQLGWALVAVTVQASLLVAGELGYLPFSLPHP
jgi:hypothetical protein